MSVIKKRFFFFCWHSVQYVIHWLMASYEWVDSDNYIRRTFNKIKIIQHFMIYRRTRQTLWGGSADANPKLLPNDT